MVLKLKHSGARHRGLEGTVSKISVILRVLNITLITVSKFKFIFHLSYTVILCFMTMFATSKRRIALVNLLYFTEGFLTKITLFHLKNLYHSVINRNERLNLVSN